MAIRDRIKQNKSQWKGALRATHKMEKGLHRVFSTIVSEISQELTNFRETGTDYTTLFRSIGLLYPRIGADTRVQ